ncbi:MAG: ComEC/Rec2 family competence protein [Ginsengibacter sp.]
MARIYKIYIWKNAPFLRLLVPFVAGIMVQYYLPFSFYSTLAFLGCCVTGILSFTFLPLFYHFRWPWVRGAFISLAIVAAGMLITWNKDVRNHKEWYGHYLDSGVTIMATLIEPPAEKARSLKALSRVEFIIQNDSVRKVDGQVLLYFAKDSIKEPPEFGDTILCSVNLQPIKNSGNPGAFDYVRYAAFHQLYHQAYVKKQDWIFKNHGNKLTYKSAIFSVRRKVRNIIYTYIPGMNEKTIAAALLIGYKVDLDKDLVQAYSNAGVVHLIAISGLHMGIIYGILFWLLSKMSFLKNQRVVRNVLIIFCLWAFAFITGGAGSVLRSAFMFSFIALGLAINKRSSIYNSMAASAFLLLVYNPFLLWDVGFQLSYLAVLGIVLCQKHISNWFFFKNKILQAAWRLSAVSIAAQIFTFPVSLFYFHQLPLLFIVANLVAIPLTIIALWLCIILIVVSPISSFAFFVGKIISMIISVINYSVEIINNVPFSLWDQIKINVTETLLLYGIICMLLHALLKKSKVSLQIALLFSFVLGCFIAIDKWNASTQNKLIVYNVPSHRAVDIIHGNSFQFIGDEELKKDGLLKNFHLKPARIQMRSTVRDEKNAAFHWKNFYYYNSKKILLVDSAVSYLPLEKKLQLDYLIISGNPRLFLSELVKTFDVGIYIFDSSNPLWKIEKWKKDCERLHLRYYSVPAEGAFVTNL